MMKERSVNNWFVEEVRGLSIQNLIPQSPDMLLDALPSPSLTLTALKSEGNQNSGSVNEDESFCFFDESHEHNTVPDTINPFWPLSELHINMKKTGADAKCRDSTMLRITVHDNNDKERLIIDTTLSMSSMVFLGVTNFEELDKLPFNSIFFTTESGIYVTEETFSGMNSLESSGLRDGGPESWGHSHKPLNMDNSESTILIPTSSGRHGEERSRFYSVEMEVEEQAKEQEQRALKEALVGKLLTVRTALEGSKGGGGGGGQIEDLETKARVTEVEKLKEEVRLAEKEAEEEEQALSIELAELKDTGDLRAHLQQIELLQQEAKRIEAERDSLRELGSKARFLLEARQLKLFSELQTIYPIEPFNADAPAGIQQASASGSSHRPSVDTQSDHGGSMVQSLNDPQNKCRWAIRGMELPPLDCPAKDEEQLATVLGYIVHVLLLICKYQQINLRYQLLYYSSRSMIRDPTATGTVNQNMPLYRTNTELDRFKKAVHWLRKDIEQVLMTKGFSYDYQQGILFNLYQVFKNEMIPQCT
eukprot:GSChrysophyteH1.ASY1.ANO1.450.1 assembled CDS